VARSATPGLLSVPAEPEALLGLATEIARATGDLLLGRFGGPATGVRAKSTATDLVSEADLDAERLIRDRLAAERPADRVLGEEGGEQAGGDGGLRWVVDPLDGTINFLFGIPQWCVSVACEDSEGAIVGVIHDACRDETFTAVRGRPPQLGGEPIVASERSDLATALVATGFAYDAEVRAAQAAVVARVLPLVRDVRRAGSAALDLAWTAAGRLDAYYERGLHPWDRAAGALLCASAGLTLSELEAAGPQAPAGLLVAPAAIAAELDALVR
jgi:myo-inositol-1(or 4)-monophosphatase